MSAIHIRLALDSDNEGILDLAGRCPQEGMITFFINRKPRYNSLHRLLDPEAWHFVACKEDQIVGLVGVLHCQTRVLDKPCKTGYILDLRVDSAYRSGMTAFKLIKAAQDHLQKSDVDIVIANFIKDNKRSLVFTSGRVKLPNAHPLGLNRILNLIPVHKMKLNKRFKIGNPDENEIIELVNLYQSYANNFKIAPILTEKRFRKYLKNIEGFSLENFYTAKENGKIKAVAALWDEHNYKSYQVLKLNRSLKVVNFALKILTRFMKVPNPIRINKPLRQPSLVIYAHDNCPEALETLFRHINNMNLGSEYTLIMIYAQEKDPMFNLLKKFKGVSVQSEMYLFAKDTSIFAKLKENDSPVLMDLTMVI